MITLGPSLMGLGGTQVTGSITYTLVSVRFQHQSPHGRRQLTRVNSTNVLDEGLRIGGIGRRMNSKVKSVKQGVYRE
jgi:hypothetical protein